jgi:peptidoglycan/LPS O-acetylase OafA/YrhL
MRSSDTSYVSRLDHLRFVAATLVLFWHIYRYKQQLPTNIVPSFWPISFLQEGHTGVALFLTMSGYLFWSKCRGKEIQYWSFIRNRLLRIAPLFAFWMFLYFYMSDVDPIKLVLAVGFLLNKASVPGNGWTVIVEFQFYLLFPFLLKFTERLGFRYLVGLVALAIFLRWSVWITSGTVQDVAYSTIFGRIDQFLIGMLVAEFVARKPALFRSWVSLSIAIVCAVAIIHWFDVKGGYFDGKGGYPSASSIWIYWPTIEGVMYALIIGLYISAEIKVPKLFDRTLANFGSYSYSMYLNQNFAIVIAFKALDHVSVPISGGVGITLFGAFVILPLLIAASAATYFLIEKPFLDLRHQYARAQQSERAERQAIAFPSRSEVRTTQ